MKSIVVVGAGIFGCVLAERIATQLGLPVLVLEERNHIGGNSWSEIDEKTGIEVHRYGSHIFHTKNSAVWQYVRRFSEFTDYRHQVFLRSQGRVYGMPINLKTINDRFGTDLQPLEAMRFLEDKIRAERIGVPKNLEEKAISLVGRELYETLIRDYTAKQWGRNPNQLPPEIITRLPVRFDYSGRYFDTSMQGVPADGYCALFKRLLDHPKIEVRLSSNYLSCRSLIPQDSIVVWTGMIDRLFDYVHGPLEWRSLRFEWETLPIPNFQGTTVVNYGDLSVPYTRIHEFKHYHPERTVPFELRETVICREYPQDWQLGREAYYPINDEPNNRKFEMYSKEVAKCPNLYVGGRLGAYQYWDMDKAVAEALSLFETIKIRIANGNSGYAQ